MSETQLNTELPEHIIEFQLGDSQYCVGLSEIVEITEPNTITSVPGAPKHVAGVTDLREQTATIVNPKLAMNIPENNDGRYAIIFDASTAGGTQIGWLVDRVHQIAELSDPDVEPVEDSSYITAILEHEEEEFLFWVDPSPINSEISSREFSQAETGESLANPSTESSSPT